MRDLIWNSRVLGAMKEHACLSEEELIVLADLAYGKSPAYTASHNYMSVSKVEKIRHRIRLKYDSIQSYLDLPPRKK